MAAAPRTPENELPPFASRMTREKERIEKMTASLRARPPRPEPGAGAPEILPREYHVRVVLSHHRFLGRWTAP